MPANDRKAKTNPHANRSQLHGQYSERYNHLLTLSPQVLVELLLEKEKEKEGNSQNIFRLLEVAIAQPKTNIENIETQGDTIVAEPNSGTSKYDMRGSKFAGGFAGTVRGDQGGGNQYNYDASEKQSLAIAAAEIQALLKQLEQTAPADSVSEKMALASSAIAQIGSNPTLKQRAVAALSAGGLKAFEAAIAHPAAAFVVGAIDGWKES